VIVNKAEFREAWWAEEAEGDDPVKATLMVEDTGESLVAHFETPEGMLTIEVGELLRSLTMLTAIESVQP